MSLKEKADAIIVDLAPLARYPLLKECQNPVCTCVFQPQANFHAVAFVFNQED